MTSSDRGATEAGYLALKVMVVIALAVSAYAHFYLADKYGVKTGTITQEKLFRAQGVMAGLAAIFLLINDRVIGWLPAFLVAIGSLAAVLTYRYINVGSIGPIPDMTDMIWRSPHNLKVISAIAEGVGTIGAAAGLLTTSVRR